MEGGDEGRGKSWLVTWKAVQWGRRERGGVEESGRVRNERGKGKIKIKTTTSKTVFKKPSWNFSKLL